MEPNISHDSGERTEVSGEERFPIIDKAVELLQKGAKNCVFIGLDANGRLIIDATLGSYEELHSAIVRASLDVTVAHNKYINELPFVTSGEVVE